MRLNVRRLSRKQKFFNKILSLLFSCILINTTGLCCLMPLPDEDLRNDFKQNVVVHEPHRTFYESFYLYYNGDPDITPVPLYSQLIDIDPSLEHEKLNLQQAIGKIDQDPVGKKLIQDLLQALSKYPDKILKELGVKHCIYSDEENEVSNILRSYNLNRILLTAGEQTNFTAPKIIRKNYQYSWKSIDNHKNFKLKIELKDCLESQISKLFLQRQDSTPYMETPFWMILAHELIHALDFLDNAERYRQDNQSKVEGFAQDINLLWPSLCDENDGLKLAHVWNYKLTELRTVIGIEKPTYNVIPSFSEMVFGIEEGEIRFPYTNQKTTISETTKETLLQAGKEHRVNILK